jgi:quercetin dioxygenase-like cupin family protein
MSEPTAPGELEARLRDVSRLAELVGYQEGGVVSRALLARETGTVTLFAFDAGQSLSEHTAPYDALVLVLEGEADLTVSGRPFHLRAGETLLMPARQPHSVRPATRFKMLLVMLRS